MRLCLAVTVVSTCVMIAVPAAAQESFVAPKGAASEAAIVGEQEWGTSSDIVFTAMGGRLPFLRLPGHRRAQ